MRSSDGLPRRTQLLNRGANNGTSTGQMRVPGKEAAVRMGQLQNQSIDAQRSGENASSSTYLNRGPQAGVNQKPSQESLFGRRKTGADAAAPVMQSQAERGRSAFGKSPAGQVTKPNPSAPNTNPIFKRSGDSTKTPEKAANSQFSGSTFTR